MPRQKRSALSRLRARNTPRPGIERFLFDLSARTAGSGATMRASMVRGAGCQGSSGGGWPAPSPPRATSVVRGQRRGLTRESILGTDAGDLVGPINA